MLLDSRGDIIDPYRNFIAKSRYSRWLEDKQRRETWSETVNRYVDFMVQHLASNNSYIVKPELVERIRYAILNHHVMPSMRALMTAGPALERSNIAGFNCSYVPMDDPRSFDEVLYILMNGTGVGFSAEKRYTDKLPVIPETIERSAISVLVQDSKEGWAAAYRELLSGLWSGYLYSWDTSLVRTAGSRLKVFGGRASGPGPLEDLFNFTVEMFQNARGRKLHDIEVHDLVCKIASVVVVGGVRRSALISLGDLDSDGHRHAKDGAWWEKNSQRALANNSAVYNEKPTRDVFDREWQALIDSGSGERGIFNRDASKRQAAKNDRRNSFHDFGTNPSLAAGTKVWTADGIFPIEQLEDKKFTVRNIDGTLSKATCWLSGRDQDIYRLSLKGGHSYDATAQHKWPVWNGSGWTKKATPDLLPGDKLKNLKMLSMFPDGSEGSREDGFALGWNLGNGWITERPGGKQIGFIVEDGDRKWGIHERLTEYFASYGSKSSLLEKKEVNVNSSGLREVFKKFGVRHKSAGVAGAMWDANVSEEFRIGYIDGLFSADGCVEKDHARIRLFSAHEKLAREVAEVLGFYGIKTSVRRRAGVTNFGEFDSWSVSITGYNNVKNFSKVFTLSNGDKQGRIDDILQNRRPLRETDDTDFIVVESVELIDDTADVWDIHVNDESHAFQLAHCVTGNCSEIILRPYQFCNLTSVVVREDDTLADLEEKVELAAILGTWQSTLTNFKYIRDIWRENTEEERLLGVSMTGPFGNQLLNAGISMSTTSAVLRHLRGVAIDTNSKLASEIGIPQSAAITCVKPEGTASQLTGTSSGLHAWHNKYYIRTVRGDKKDAMTQFLSDSGVYVEDDVMNPDATSVFHFPIKAPDGALTRNDISAIEHLELWLTYQRDWCEHKPSVTIYVKNEEWAEVGDWVYKNFDEISGISFLPHSEHTYAQAPYQDLTKDQYLEWVEKTPSSIDWSWLSLYEKSDETTGTQELSCVAGSCDVVDIGSANVDEELENVV